MFKEVIRTRIPYLIKTKSFSAIQFTGSFECFTEICAVMHPHHAERCHDKNGIYLKIKYSRKDKNYCRVDVGNVIVKCSKQRFCIYSQEDFEEEYFIMINLK